MQQLHAAAADALRGVDDALGRRRGVKGQVLDAVLILAGREDLFRMDTDRFAHAVGARDRACGHFFSHGNTS